MNIPNQTQIGPRFEWGPLFAGVALALAISIVLLQFGSIIGLSASAPLRGEANIAAWGVVATGIWLLWVQLLASLAGGYLAGWLRRPLSGVAPHDVEMRDGIAGLSTWAISTVIVFIGISLVGAFSTYISVVTDTYQVNESLTNTEKNTTIIFAFIAGATSLLSAVAAWWAGTMGGEHRDKGTDFSHYVSFRR